jgi:methionyl aminopeptidase
MKLNEKQIHTMRRIGPLLGWVLALTAQAAKPGITLAALDAFAYERIKQARVKAAFLNYKGYRYATCLSLNDALVHGIPNNERIRTGDVLGIDIGVKDEGVYVDSAHTIIIGVRDAQDSQLLKVTESALMAGIAQVRDGVHLGDVQAAIAQVITKAHLGIVRDLCGHGIGPELQMEPRILNFGERGTGPILNAGMALAIEPMVTLGDWHVVTDPDGWTVRTADGKRAAHFEHTILVTQKGSEILTSRPQNATLSAYARVLGRMEELR